ncbi:MAG: DUF6279 family lipoprotein [Burkholderiales bacterium]
MRKTFLLPAACVVLLAACSMPRIAYNNADTALRYQAWRYFDLDRAQSGALQAGLSRFHAWHRVNELPLYTVLLKDAGRRVARGVGPEDVAWAMSSLRARYRRLLAEAVEEAAPILVTLGPAQLAVLEHKVAEDNADYAREFLPREEKKRQRAQLKRALGQFRNFIGELTPEQQSRIERFVKANERHAVLRFEERQRWQRDAIALIRQQHEPQVLAQRLAELFTGPESRRSEEFLREDRRWEEDLARLIVDLNRTLSPAQRARAVKRLDGYAEDCLALAAGNGEAI